MPRVDFRQLSALASVQFLEPLSKSRYRGLAQTSPWLVRHSEREGQIGVDPTQRLPEFGQALQRRRPAEVPLSSTSLAAESYRIGATKKPAIRRGKRLK